MTPEHTALVAELSNLFKTGSNYTVRRIAGQAAAAIRALAGENVELRDDRAIRHIERTALRAEVERLKQDLAHDRHQWNLAVSDAEEARAEVAALKIDNQTLRDLLAVAEERDEL